MLGWVLLSFAMRHWVRELQFAEVKRLAEDVQE